MQRQAALRLVIDRGGVHRHEGDLMGQFGEVKFSVVHDCRF